MKALVSWSLSLIVSLMKLVLLARGKSLACRRRRPVASARNLYTACWIMSGGDEDAEDLLALLEAGTLARPHSGDKAPRSAKEGRKSICAIAHHSFVSIHSRFSSGGHAGDPRRCVQG
jgi:hypothetical protein